MNYRVVLIESDEGYAVGCPAPSGCWSQGATRKEALENIHEAIREVLEVKHEHELELTHPTIVRTYDFVQDSTLALTTGVCDISQTIPGVDRNILKILASNSFFALLQSHC